MASITDIRDGIAARFRTIAGIHVYDEWPDTILPPAVLVRPVSAQYEQTFGSTDWTRMQVEALVVVTTQGGLANAERALEPYISNSGALSLRAALAGDRQLQVSGSGTVKYAFVRGWRNYDVIEVNAMELLGAVVDIEVEAQ